MNSRIDGENSRGAAIAPLLVVFRYRGIIVVDGAGAEAILARGFRSLRRRRCPGGPVGPGPLHEEPEPSIVAELATIGSGGIGRRSQR